MEATAVCNALFTMALAGETAGTVHSVFDHAVNVELGCRLAGVVAEPGSLPPYGAQVRITKPFCAYGVKQGGPVRLTQAGLSFANGLTVSFGNAAHTDLSVESIAAEANMCRQPLCLQPVLSVLRAGGTTDGLSVLVTGLATNVYAEFLSQRLPALYAAVEAGDAEAANLAAARIAGCGVGLTPSSDDLLTGYLIAVRLMSLTGRMRDVRALLPDMARAASHKTNRISGAFLTSSGEGLASSDFRMLMKQLFFLADASGISNSAGRVAQFGSTSGRDMLTGLVLAIQHHDGGKNSGKTGNPEKRVF